jgi:hypothetical protein
MAETSVDLVRSMYDAFATGDIPAVVTKMDPCDWEGIRSKNGLQRRRVVNRFLIDDL